MEFVGTSTGANANRDCGGAIDAFPLLDDFLQLDGGPTDIAEAAITFSGLTPKANYIVTIYSHNQGAFQQSHAFYEGTTSGTNLGTFITNFNPSAATPDPALAAIPFQLTSNGSGEILVTMTAVPSSDPRLTINGFSITATATPPPFNLAITPNATAGLYDFQWSSQDGKVYDLLTSTDLSTPIADWPVYDDGSILYENLPATGTTTTLTGVPSGEVRRFFALREEDAPPIPLSLNE